MMLKKNSFRTGLYSYPNGLRRTRSIFCHLQNGLKFCKWVRPPHSIQQFNVFGHQKHVASCPGSAIWYIHHKNWRKFIEWQKATKLVMHTSYVGRTLWKKFGFIWRMSKKTSFGWGLCSYPNGLRRTRSIFCHLQNWLKFCKWVGMPTPHSIQELNVFGHQ